MNIQFNTDRSLTLHDEFRNKLNNHLTEKLSRFSNHITRLEVHLSDENGNKKGQDDKKCVLEARVESRPSIAVTAAGNNYELAIDAAVSKLKSSLNTIMDRIKDH